MSNDQLFPNMQAAVESEENVVTEIESYCVNCGEDGITRMLLTEIPFFKVNSLLHYCVDYLLLIN